jgi:hypothetical protein
VTHRGAGDDAAAGDHGVHGHAATLVVVEDELGRRQLLLIGPDGPVVVVEAQRRRDADQLQVGLPEGIDGADVAPVGLLAALRIAERIGDDAVAPDDAAG